jgi:hypothetical protein
MLPYHNMVFDLLMCSNQMTLIRFGAVFALTLIMASLWALLSVGGLRRADPVDTF